MKQKFIDMNRNGEVTDCARCLKARYTAGFTNFKGDNSGVIIPQGEKIIYDAFNNSVKADQSCVGTLTGNCGVESLRSGVKLIMRENEAVKGKIETDNEVIEGEFRIRKLTPRECFRLQGIPDEYFERAESVNSDSQLYKQAGNGVTVNVIYDIAKRLEN